MRIRSRDQWNANPVILSFSGAPSDYGDFLQKLVRVFSFLPFKGH
jgi:hypothetical protein